MSKNPEELQITLGHEIVSSYKRLSYQPWYALAEYVDNSTQAYKINQEVLSKSFEKSGEKLKVEIIYDPNASNNGSIIIRDNSIGMSFDDIKNAIIIGKPPKDISGRSRYGLGLKTASFWLGNQWSIRTKKLNDENEYTVTFEADKIAAGNMKPAYASKKVDKLTHYTEVTITHLNRKFVGNTLKKISDYLKSMYRIDISSGNMDLFWQGKKLEWNYEEIFANLYVDEYTGEKVKKNFDFVINKKKVTGWAGVINIGIGATGRDKAGFAIIQSDRVIKDSYRPGTLFGFQEGGSNDLVNQRLVGEIHLDDFEVSHTKDEILFEGDDEEKLENALKEKCGDLKTIAEELRKTDTIVERITSVDAQVAIDELKLQLLSDKVSDFIKTYEMPPEQLIEASNSLIVKSVSKSFTATFIVNLGGLTVKLFVVTDVSVYEPYLITRAASSDNEVTVIVNKMHPHWKELKSSNSIYNYLKHCVYDGVAEWKAYKLTSKFEPDTIKSIKDNLLRLNIDID